MSKPEVSVVIVNYNTAKEIDECLQSVYSLPSAVNIAVIIVDNASTDNSVSIIKKFKNVKLIQNKTNSGFAKANNIGARAAHGNFLFFLNPDTQIKKDTIEKLLEFSKKNPHFIAGPKILNPDGSIQGSCYNLPTILGAIEEYWLSQKGTYEKFAPKGNQPVQVEAIVGAAMLMPKSIFERLGRFDERYFLYYEDLDFCRKAKQLQIPIYYYPKASVIHSLGKAGGNIAHLKKSAQIYHGILKYFLITLIIKTSRWLKL